MLLFQTDELTGLDIELSVAETTLDVETAWPDVSEREDDMTLDVSASDLDVSMYVASSVDDSNEE